jgi:hypothetical protein
MRVFETTQLPSFQPSLEELLLRRKQEFARKDAAMAARRLVPVRVTVDGPYGIAHFGDPHVDDPGTDIALLERHVSAVSKTYGLFAGNIGDMHNNWVGKLIRLYAKQETTAKESWMIVEWLMRAMPWLYVVMGNHDLWSGDGDPLEYMLKSSPGVNGKYGVRINLESPNGTAVRVNARHDFHGHSMWNTVHGPVKAAKMGWRDHILICGHKHTSGYAIEKDPATGLISHVLRVASYKTHDDYAEELGLPNQCAFPSCVTIIDPEEPDDSVRRVTFFPDVELGADYLTWLRHKRGF